MSYYAVIEWNPADAIPFGWEYHTSRAYETREEIDGYVARVQQRAELTGAQLYDIAVFDHKPKDVYGYVADYDRGVYIKDLAIWRLDGLKKGRIW